MQSNKKRMIKLAALMLAILSVVTLITPIYAASDSYDFSNAGADKTEERNSVALLEEKLGESLSAAEKSFLDSYSTLVLKYSPVINANKIELSYETGVLTVTAKEYTYVGENGKELKWIPESATVNGVNKALVKSGTDYVVTFDTDGGRDAEVTYKASAEITKNDFNALQNLYYYTAKYAFDMEDYEKKKIKYEEYVYAKRLYDDALAEYNRYLEDYAEYEELKYKFEHYDELLKQYESDKEKYDAYLESLNTKAEDIKKYEEYEAKLAKIRKQLSAFELVYVKMKDNRQIYSAVKGGTVDQVLGSVGTIVKRLGKDYKNMVETAEDATISLRVLMDGYRECKTEEDKYVYYVSNYEKICDSIFDLTWSLDRLYYAPGVEAGMKAFEKHEKYVILVAQLVLTSNALIDSELRAPNDKIAYNSNWKMDDRTCAQILNNVKYFEDDNSSTPLAGGYPTAVPKPDIKEVEKPKIPEKPASRPIPPTAVANPGKAPSVVTEPSAPNAALSAALDAYSKLNSTEKSKLAVAYSNKSVTKRNDITSAVTMNLQTKVSKMYNAELVTLVFKVPENAAGDPAFTHTITTDKGTPIAYNGVIPKTYTTSEGTYKFAGWKTVEGRVNLASGFEKDMELTPVYDRLPKYYNVTWVVNGESIVESHISGEIPAPNFAPSQPDDGIYCYDFARWNKTPGILLSDVTYIAIFEQKCIVPTATGEAALSVSDNTMICDLSSSLNEKIDLSRLMPRINGKYALKILTSVGSVDFTFTDVVAMAKLGVNEIELNIRESAGNYIDIVLKLYDENSKEITEGNINADLKIVHNVGDIAKTVLKCENEYVKFNADAEYLSYRAKFGKTYRFTKEYSVVVIKSTFVDITVDKETVYRNDIVKFEVTKKPGVVILGISVTDEKGNKISFDRFNRTVEVTDKDIVISVRAKYILYNVAFISNGVTISEQELIYGTEPYIPKSPTIASDREYSYEFTGWSPEVSPVTCDITYEAQFKKVPIPVTEDGTSNAAPNPFMKYLKIAVIAASVLILAIAGLITFFIVRGVRKNKRIAKRAGNDKQTSDNNSHEVQNATSTVNENSSAEQAVDAKNDKKE